MIDFKNAYHELPLSPQWSRDSTGKGDRKRQAETKSTCGTAQQSPRGTVAF